MGNRPLRFAVYVPAPPNESAANTETVIATLNGVQSEFPGQQVWLSGFVALTPGAAATAMTVRIRRDSLTGTLVNTAAPNAGDITAAKLSTIPLDCVDSRQGDFAGAYVVTIQGTGEGGAATCAAACLTATVS